MSLSDQQVSMHVSGLISTKCFELVFLAPYKTSLTTHGYVSVIFKRFINVLQLFKEAFTVFFMGTVVRRCSVEDSKFEKGRQFCLLQHTAVKREPDKTVQAAEEGWREKQMKTECKRKS